jgi:hypothetical protein
MEATVSHDVEQLKLELGVIKEADASPSLEEHAEPMDSSIMNHKMMVSESWRARNVDGEWFHSFFNCLLNGEEYQNLGETPSFFRGVIASLFSLFGGGSFDVPDDLSDDARAATAACKEVGNGTLLGAFRWVYKNWTTLRDSPILKHMSCLLSIGILVGFAPPEWSTFHLKAYRVYKIETAGRFSSALEMADGFMDSLNYFVEATVASWEVGNLSPFFFERTTAAALDSSYEEIAEIVPQIITGSWFEDPKNCFSELMQRMNNTIEAYKVAVAQCAPRSVERKLLHTRQLKLSGWCLDIAIMRRGGSYCKQAWSAIVSGPAGIGKSLIQRLLAALIFQHYGVKYDEALIANLNPDDKYHSTITNSTMIVRIDDVANRPLKYDESLGIAAALQMINNVPFIATKAELEEKGRVIPDLRAVIGSTNNPEMWMDLLSVHPESLRRRVNRNTVRVKAPWANTDGTVNWDKVESNPPPKIKLMGITVKDMVLIDIETSGVGGYKPKVISYRGRKVALKNLDLAQYLFFQEKCLRLHDEEQEEYVGAIKNVKARKCDRCGFLVCPPTCPGHINQFPADTEFEEEDSVPAPEGPEVHQSAITDAAIRTLKLAIEDRVGDVPFLGGMCKKVVGTLFEWLWPEALLVSALTVAIEFVSRESYTQWWFWIPDGVWEWQVWRHVAGVLQDVELRQRIRMAQNKFYTNFLLMFVSFCCLVIEFKYQQRLQLRYQALMTTLPMLLLAKTSWPTPRARSFTMFALGVGTIYKQRSAAIFVISLFQFFCFGFIMKDLRTNAYAYLTAKRNAVGEFGREVRERYSPALKAALLTLSTVGAGYMAYTLYNTFGATKEEDAQPVDAGSPTEVQQSLMAQKVMPDSDKHEPPPHINFMDNSNEMLERRNALRNTWCNDVVKTSFGTKDTATYTPEQFLGVVKKNISTVHVLQGSDWKPKCNAFYRCGDLAEISAHDAPTGTEIWLITDNEKPHSHKKITVDPTSVFKERPDSETVLIYLPKGSKQNMNKFCTEQPATLNDIVFIHRDLETKKATMRPTRLAQYLPDKAHTLTYQWGNSEEQKNFLRATDPSLSEEALKIGKTFAGACGGVYVTNSKFPVVVGIHYACAAKDMSWGRSQICSSVFVEATLLHIQQNCLSMCLTANPPENWIPTINGKQAFEHQPDHSGSLTDQVTWCQENIPDMQRYLMVGEPARAAVKEAQIPETKQSAVSLAPGGADQHQGALYIGARQMAAFYKSKAVKTLIAESVAMKFPDQPAFAGPRFGRSMWPKSAGYSYESSPGLPQAHLEWATRDYLLDLLQAFRKSEALHKHARPLTWCEALNGVPGVKYLDAMNWSTSMGLGFTGKKRTWLYEFLDEEGNPKKDFLSEVWERVKWCLEQLEAGRRVPWVFSATPKDEPTPTDKDKVRLFMVGEVACVILVRMYFTPLCRILQMLTATSECAVGMNATSYDWEAVMQYLEQFSLHFDGDHKKYDLVKAQQISRASYRILIEIASWCNYTSKDLFVMQMMVADLVQPLVNFNGHVVVLEGSTPSGIPLTVIINGLDNSLMNRCGFKACYPDAPVGTFRVAVKHINYGDDFINAVHRAYAKFNFLALQEYLSLYGIHVTPGVKDSEGRKFVEFDELVFLQRRSRYEPRLGHRIGALEEKSITKMLSCVLASSSMTRGEATAMNIDTALQEYVHHSPEIFSDRQEWLRGAATEVGIAHMCRNINRTNEELFQALHSEV